MKKFLLTFLVAFAAGMGSMMYADFYEGSCSETVFWNIDDNEGVLTIYGEGEIPTYSEGGGAWVDYINEEKVVSYVIIGEGITSIGAYSFARHYALQAVQIASSVTSMGYMAFGYCNSLSILVFKGATPPYMSECTFCEMGQVDKIYVPVGSSSAYASWGYGDYCRDLIEGEPSSLTPVKPVYTQLDDTTVCSGSSVKVGTCSQYVYSTKTISCTLTSAAGGDSIVSRKVIVDQVTMPYVTSQNITGSTANGAIKIYDTYKYTDAPEGEVTKAHYDYITVNGVRYDHKPSATEEAVYVYNMSNAAVSFQLTDLQPGTYEILFYLEDCSLATLSTTVTITFQYAYIDGLYYNSYTEYAYEGTQYKQVVRAEVTHREYSESNSYSLSKIEIPDTITIGNNKYAVKRIGSSAFYKCTNLSSVTIPKTIESIQSSAFAGCSNLKEIILYPSSCPSVNTYSFTSIASDAIFYVPMNLCSSYRSSYNWKSLNIQPAVKVSYEAGPTSCTLTFTGLMDEIVACSVLNGEKEQGNTLSYVGLEPSSTYSNVDFVVYNKENVSATLQTTFLTGTLELVTLESKPTSNTSAILLAQTNLDEAETQCGFEWKRNDAPSDMAGKKEYATTANGIMAGRLMGLREDVYYKYRAFYESAAGKMYYGGWQYIFTGDAGVEFEPIIYTESAQKISEREATLLGYALEGSEPITEQGFEYWAERRVRLDEFAEQETEFFGTSELGQVHKVAAEGIAMQATLTELEAGTLYKYRAYAKAGGKTYYGKEAAFVTLGAYGGQDVDTAVDQVSEAQEAQKILRDGQILILRGDRTYTLQGQEVR